MSHDPKKAARRTGQPFILSKKRRAFFFNGGFTISAPWLSINSRRFSRVRAGILHRSMKGVASLLDPKDPVTPSMIAAKADRAPSADAYAQNAGSALNLSAIPTVSGQILQRFRLPEP